MNLAPRELPEFVRVERGRRTALVHPDFMPQLADALLDGRGVSTAGLSGRAGMLRCETPLGKLLIRPYRRGGMMAKLLNDRYILSNRPKWELEVHSLLWRGGVPTVMPLGAMWERYGIFVRGSFATLEADAIDLLQYLQENQTPDPNILATCGRAIRDLHRFGLWHPDLQVKNILIKGKDALLIDFDGTSPALRLTAIAPVLRRLKRSFVKRGLSLDAYEVIRKAAAAD